MTTESRRSQRRKVDQTILVIDTMTGQQLGTVVDLSETGLRLMTDTAMNADALFQCELRFTQKQCAPINVGMHELWCSESTENSSMLIGFRFIDISKDDRFRLREWVAEPGSQYT